MSEEIIINDVDVAKCCYYDAKNDKGDWCDLTCTREHAPYFRCESMPNCYYKQLQRLKQENEQLNITLEDRIDVNGDYCPENCRWINIHEQCKNKRNTLIYTYNNETLCLKDWADKFKMNYPTLQGRLKKGWSFEDAITIPIRKCSKRHTGD